MVAEHAVVKVQVLLTAHQSHSRRCEESKFINVSSFSSKHSDCCSLLDCIFDILPPKNDTSFPEIGSLSTMREPIS